MDRVIQAEIEGKQNIVIGGQGEAEVNTQWTPRYTSRHLYSVAEQCGYMTNGLQVSKDDMTVSLDIYTDEGEFKIVWKRINTTVSPLKLVYIKNLHNPKGWSWKNENPFRKAG